MSLLAEDTISYIESPKTLRKAVRTNKITKVGEYKMNMQRLGWELFTRILDKITYLYCSNFTLQQLKSSYQRKHDYLANKSLQLAYGLGGKM